MCRVWGPGAGHVLKIQEKSSLGTGRSVRGGGGLCMPSEGDRKQIGASTQ